MSATILISTDLKDTSLLAIEAGQQLAKNLSCQACVFHLHKGSDDQYGYPLFPELSSKTHDFHQILKDNLSQALTEQVQPFQSKQLKIQTQLFFAKNLEKISDIVKTLKAKILVLPYQNSEFDSFLAGPSMEKLLRTSRIPVVIAKNKSILNCKKILFPFAFQGLSEDALEMAVMVAEAFQAKIVPLHIWQKSSKPQSFETIGSDERDGVSKEQRPHYQYLKTRFQELKNRSLIEDVLVVPSKGKAKETLLHQIEGQNPDLVVMGSSGLNALQRLYLGSFCEYLLRNGHTSLMITKKF